VSERRLGSYVMALAGLRTSELDRLYPKWDIGGVRRILAPNEKPLHWVGSSKREFLGFPEPVRDDMGNALGVAQFGGSAPTAKA